jgi:hypothetical protein
MEAQDMIAPAEMAEAMDSTEAKEPIEPMENADPTLPMDMKEFLDAIERNDPVESVERMTCILGSPVGPTNLRSWET